MHLLALTCLSILCNVYAEVETTAHLAASPDTQPESTSEYGDDLPNSLTSFDWLISYMKYEHIDYEYLTDNTLKITIPKEMTGEPFAEYMLKRMFPWMKQASEEPELAKWKTMFSKDMQDLINVYLFKMFHYDQKDFGNYTLEDERKYDLIKWIGVFAKENSYKVLAETKDSITLELNELDQEYDIIIHIFQVIGALMVEQGTVKENVDIMSRYLIEKEFQSISNLISIDFDEKHSTSEYDSEDAKHKIILPKTVFPFADQFLRHLHVEMRHEPEDELELTIPDSMVGEPLVDYIYPRIFEWMSERLSQPDLMRFSKIFSLDFEQLVQEHIQDKYSLEKVILDEAEMVEERNFTLIDFMRRFAEKNNLQVVKETNSSIEIQASEYSEEEEYNLLSHIFVLLGQKMEQDSKAGEKLGLFARFLIANELNEFFYVGPQKEAIAKRQLNGDGSQANADGEAKDVLDKATGENETQSGDSTRGGSPNDSRAGRSGQSGNGSRNRQRNNQRDAQNENDGQSGNNRNRGNRNNNDDDEGEEDDDGSRNNGASRGNRNQRNRGNEENEDEEGGNGQPRRNRNQRNRGNQDEEDDEGGNSQPRRNRNQRNRGNEDEDDNEGGNSQPRRNRNRQNEDSSDEEDEPSQNGNGRNGNRDPMDDEDDESDNTTEGRGQQRGNRNRPGSNGPRGQQRGNGSRNRPRNNGSNPNRDNDEEPRRQRGRRNRDDDEEESPRRRRNRQDDDDDQDENPFGYPSRNRNNGRFNRGRNTDPELEDVLEELNRILSNPLFNRMSTMSRQPPNTFMRYQMLPFHPPMMHGFPQRHIHRSMNSPVRRPSANFFKPLRPSLEENEIEIEDMKITEFVKEFREKASSLVKSPSEMRQLFLVIMKEIYDNLLDD